MNLLSMSWPETTYYSVADGFVNTQNYSLKKVWKYTLIHFIMHFLLEKSVQKKWNLYNKKS